jgi:hypothetical protein
MHQPSKWEDYIHSVAFAYNNGYQASLKMSPFEALYGRKYNTQVSWDNLVDIIIIGTYLLREMEEKMTKIKRNLKAAQHRQKSYAENNTFFRDFNVGEHFFSKSESEMKFTKIGLLPKVGSKILWDF